MAILRQSTATTLVFGPFVDATDGHTLETSLAINDINLRISKNGDEATAPNDQGGWEYLSAAAMYGVSLSAVDTNTCGRLDCVAYISGARPIFRTFQVVEEAVYDALYATGAAAIAAVSSAEVSASRTWYATEYRARNIVEVATGFVGTFALAPDLNTETTIATVSSATLSGPTSVTATGLTVDASKTKAHFTVPALNTAGTYTVTVTVVTVDSQTIVTTATLRVV